MELMHAEVAATIASTPVDSIDDQFIRATYDHALTNVCIKYPDIAHKLRGGNVVLTCSKAVKKDTTNKRKAALISAETDN